MTTFSIKREETIHYYIDYSREDVIDALAFALAEGDAMVEKGLGAVFSKFTDEQLYQAFSGELDEYGDLYDYIIECSEKYGDVQANDIEVTMQKEGE